VFATSDDRSFPTVEQAMAYALSRPAALGDEVEQHEAGCKFTANCGCRVIDYVLTPDGWKISGWEDRL
jgi:hypothetical protein